MTGRSEGDNERRRKRRRGGRREEWLSGSRQKLCLKCQFNDAFCVCVCVFSALCVHADGIRHQRNISRHSWIDRGEGEDPEWHQYENIQLLGFCVWMHCKKEGIRNHCFVSLCVFDMRAGIVMRHSLQTRCYLPALFSCTSHKPVYLTLIDRYIDGERGQSRNKRGLCCFVFLLQAGDNNDSQTYGNHTASKEGLSFTWVHVHFWSFVPMGKKAK